MQIRIIWVNSHWINEKKENNEEQDWVFEVKLQISFG